MSPWRRSPVSSLLMLGASVFFVNLGATPAAFAVAPVDPALTVSVVQLCAQVADEELNGDDTHRGQCIARTMDWIAALVPPPTVTVEESDKAIADFVAQLASLPQLTRTCTEFNNEIAQAINLASNASHDSEQKARIEQIAFTIGNCVPQVITAAISASPL